jgi:hypothetical protein
VSLYPVSGGVGVVESSGVLSSAIFVVVRAVAVSTRQFCVPFTYELRCAQDGDKTAGNTCISAECVVEQLWHCW